MAGRPLYNLPNATTVESGDKFLIQQGVSSKQIDEGVLASLYKDHATSHNKNPADGSAHNADDIGKAGGGSIQDFIDSFALKILQSPTNGGLTEIQTRTVDAGEVYEVRKTSDDSLATIYSNAKGTTEIVQNGTDNKSDSDGVVKFYIADGDYYVAVNSVQSNFSVDLLRKDLANPDKGASTVARGVVAVDSIDDLISLPDSQRREDLRYLVKGYHSGSESGGNAFSWQPYLPSSRHNGGTIIALGKEFPSDWSDIPAVEEWFRSPTTDLGCFVASKTDSTRVTSAEFGVTAGAAYSQRPAYQAALSSLASTGGLVASGVDSISLDTDMAGVALEVPNNVWIDNRSCKLKLLPTDFGGYSIVRFSEGITDLSGIFGGEVIGDKHTHLGTTGEWGMGIDIRGASSVVVKDISSNQCWGDGIYIGKGANTSKQAGMVLLDNVLCDDNRRQGLSITHAKRVVIPRGYFTRTSGADPQSGIDIEPNLGEEVTEVEFGEVNCSGNAGYGFLTVKPKQPAIIGNVHGREIITSGNGKSGVSIETADRFYCDRLITSNNNGSGADITTVRSSHIEVLESRNNKNISSVRSSCVNYRSQGRHSAGRITIIGGNTTGAALLLVAEYFECGTISIEGVSHQNTSAVGITGPDGISARSVIGNISLDNMPRGGVSITGGMKAEIGNISLGRMDTLEAGTRIGVLNQSVNTVIGGISASAGSGLYYVLRNSGNNSFIGSVIAGGGAVVAGGSAVYDTSTGTIVAHQIG